MPYLTNTDSAYPADIHYEDYGEGKPVILIHGWPLSHRAWEPQVAHLVESGFRVIAYCRRGFGISSAPWNGYDYDGLTSDLRALILELDLKDVALVGFSMGGGEVVRYFTKYDGDRVTKAALISSIIPLVPKKDNNPDGVPQEDLDGIMEQVRNDRAGFLRGFLRNFYGYEDNQDRISEAQLHYDWSIAVYASPRATIKAAEAWATTDFRPECKNVNVPTLIVHGTGDAIVPIETSADQAAELIPDNEYHKIENAPHGLNHTHRKELNELLVNFLK